MYLLEANRKLFRKKERELSKNQLSNYYYTPFHLKQISMFLRKETCHIFHSQQRVQIARLLNHSPMTTIAKNR